MVEKLKQYPVTALTVVAMVLIALLLGELAWFRKLAVVLLTWWVGVGFERPVNEMIAQEKLGKLVGKGFVLVATAVFAAVVTYVQIRF
ncbi:hypothetical protein FC48_GL001268 [Ligilactobacillus murinus DSM 20452 = NBRC 14221]|jgi:hypothetical protein|uniref:Uncharacterized protein n=1 Tax=Ligilactobacillus murinus DSM 20452 = NBRC 14221 TaxID=1423772 RepID=A0A0R2BD51_9LACO|nr:hypothetical protein [Ligilactobacillus murinus]GFI63602.1 hypothetical protein IMSAG117_01017 [Lactobacillaceae bacterium]HBV48237.1 hypothetical protein [Lactobacillus sp.]KRM76890.1 hypothetical protein FC48_GL001268 [Ligilactobacillus murinus DSM 20452 = NBRC 14221]MBF0758434.1 hypothetical protein [Ligilactobacillus murinus]MBF0831434.1 hypothetical protein [Ligilactobacillus murinus]